ncbi:hypothetical protein C0J52_16687 [Blattella germanica]|nr:hypothetical protein C0J52_16687 [Blattella germanica]
MPFLHPHSEISILREVVSGGCKCIEFKMFNLMSYFIILVVVLVLIGVGIRRKPLKSDGREIVMNVYKFFLDVYEGLSVGRSTISVTEVVKRTVAAIDVSEYTVYRLLKEKRKSR